MLDDLHSLFEPICLLLLRLGMLGLLLLGEGTDEGLDLLFGLDELVDLFLQVLRDPDDLEDNALPLALDEGQLFDDPIVVPLPSPSIHPLVLVQVVPQPHLMIRISPLLFLPNPDVLPRSDGLPVDLPR